MSLMLFKMVSATDDGKKKEFCEEARRTRFGRLCRPVRYTVSRRNVPEHDQTTYPRTREERSGSMEGE